MDSKTCFKCGKEKPLTMFYKHSGMADGYLGKCKKCTKADSNKYREDNLEEVRACDRKRGLLPHRIKAREKYAQTPSGKKARQKAQYKWVVKNPKKIIAQGILRYAINIGKIKKEPCEKCGSVIRIHGHHDDYTKPLDVHWLCPKCHSLHHKQLRDIMRTKQ